MKLEDLSYAVIQKVFWELEHSHHFVVPQEVQKEVIKSVTENLDELIR